MYLLRFPLAKSYGTIYLLVSKHKPHKRVMLNLFQHLTMRP